MVAKKRTYEQNARIERLAKELHRHYRAGEKALGLHSWKIHDHGWDGCHRQKYFRQRAVRELRRDVDKNRATHLASHIITTLEYIGVDFSGHKLTSLLEVAMHVEDIMREVQ